MRAELAGEHPPCWARQKEEEQNQQAGMGKPYSCKHAPSPAGRTKAAEGPGAWQAGSDSGLATRIPRRRHSQLTRTAWLSSSAPSIHLQVAGALEWSKSGECSEATPTPGRALTQPAMLPGVFGTVDTLGPQEQQQPE